MIKPSGEVYSGNWKNSKAHGYGEYSQLNGNRYVGYWQDDK